MRRGGAGWYAKGMFRFSFRFTSLRLAPERILTEQLRLLHVNVPPSFIAAGLVSVLVVAVFFSSAQWQTLGLWLVAVWLVVAAALALARRFLRELDGGGQPASVTVTAYQTIALYSAFGAVWGAMGWVLPASAGYGGTAMIIGVSAGMVAGGMAFMSPVLPVFLGYMTFWLAPLVVWLAIGDDLFSRALAIGTCLFFVCLTMQARAAERAFRSMVELRFENVELVARLRSESGRALAARGEAEEANRAKSKFLAAASHDLRQPVHAQGLFLEVLARSPLTDEQREVLAHARAAGTASGDMLNTLLDFSRIEAGVVAPQVRPFRLQPLLHKLETELAPQADAKGIVYRSRETHAVVASDAALVELILRNLVSNAIRYTETGGVLVGCRQRGSAVMIEVWDTGIGIAREHLGDVFREFHQLGNPERDRRKGLGLGLAIAKGLSDTLGHALMPASRAGRGSVFRLTLPLTDAPVPAEESTGTGGQVRLLNARVLVIDDDEAVRSGMLRLLRDWGAECAVAESIDEALALLRGGSGAPQFRPELVISDYRLREQSSGAQAIAAVRAEMQQPVAALLITGDTAPERLREAQASGAPLLHKPVQPNDLYRAILRALE